MKFICFFIFIILLLLFIILFIYNKKDKLTKKIIKSFYGSLYLVAIISLNILATINDVIFELLLLICFALPFIYNKKDELIQRLYKSSLHSLAIGIITFLVAISFLNSSYDVQDLYPDIPIFGIIEFLGYTSIYVIPLLYIFVFLITKKDLFKKIIKKYNKSCD